MLRTNTSTTNPTTRVYLPFEEFAERIVPLLTKEEGEKSAEKSIEEEKELIENLYQDYQTNTNEKFPPFLKQNYRRKKKEEVISFVGK